jgi:hypothetical protein
VLLTVGTALSLENKKQLTKNYKIRCDETKNDRERKKK